MTARLLSTLLVVLAISSRLPAVSIWTIGDSLTSGFTSPGAYRSQLHRDLTAAGLDVDFVGSATNDSNAYLRSVGEINHDGHSGWFIANTLSTIDDGRNILDNVSLWARGFAAPDIILLLIGTNDLNHGNSVAAAPGRTRLLIRRLEILAPNARILVSSLPLALENNIYKDPAVRNLDTSIQAYNTALQDIVDARATAGAHVEFIDLYHAMDLSMLHSDGLHLSQQGYDFLGSLWADAILAPEPSCLLLLAFAGPMVWRRLRD